MGHPVPLARADEVIDKGPPCYDCSQPLLHDPEVLPRLVDVC